MSLETEGTIDPTAGASAGASAEGQPAAGTQAQTTTPAGRSYSDADMAAARRSFQAESQREWTRREQALRSELESRFITREQPKPNDPWSQFDPSVAAAIRAAVEHEIQARVTPFQQQQEDLQLRNDEAELKSKYPDYGKNRTDILEFAVQHNIADLDTAYRAWKFDELSQLDPKKIGQAAVAEHIKKKTTQATSTPSVEGRGGGSPSTKQAFKSREDMDDAVIAMLEAGNA